MSPRENGMKTRRTSTSRLMREYIPESSTGGHYEFPPGVLYYIHSATPSLYTITHPHLKHNIPPLPTTSWKFLERISFQDSTNSPTIKIQPRR